MVKFAHFVERHRVNSMITEQDISSLMVVTDRDEDSDAKTCIWERKNQLKTREILVVISI